MWRFVTNAECREAVMNINLGFVKLISVAVTAIPLQSVTKREEKMSSRWDYCVVSKHREPTTDCRGVMHHIAREKTICHKPPLHSFTGE